MGVRLGGGALSKNTRTDNPKAPGYTGGIKFDVDVRAGEWLDLAAWLVDDPATGGKKFSLAISEQQRNNAPARPAPRQAAADDDLPY